MIHRRVDRLAEGMKIILWNGAWTVNKIWRGRDQTIGVERISVDLRNDEGAMY